jgi:hypothetical protein
MSNKGIKTELSVSKKFHSTGVPLLVSGSLLKIVGAKQIDLARVKYNRVELLEVKSSSMGLASFYSENPYRKNNAINLIAHIMNKEVCFFAHNPFALQR